MNFRRSDRVTLVFKRVALPDEDHARVRPKNRLQFSQVCFCLTGAVTKLLCRAPGTFRRSQSPKNESQSQCQGTSGNYNWDLFSTHLIPPARITLHAG